MQVLQRVQTGRKKQPHPLICRLLTFTAHYIVTPVLAAAVIVWAVSIHIRNHPDSAAAAEIERKAEAVMKVLVSEK